MPLKKKDRDALKAAIAANVAPKFARDPLTLQLASKRVVLASANGRKTAAGNLYERETVQQLPRALANAPVPMRVENSEFLTLLCEARRDAYAPGTPVRIRSVTRVGYQVLPESKGGGRGLRARYH